MCPHHSSGSTRTHRASTADIRPAAISLALRQFRLNVSLSRGDGTIPFSSKGTSRARFQEDLRHTFASQLAMAGVPIKTIQELMGFNAGVRFAGECRNDVAIA